MIQKCTLTNFTRAMVIFIYLPIYFKMIMIKEQYHYYNYFLNDINNDHLK
jgi:hypothetical protein